MMVFTYAAEWGLDSAAGSARLKEKIRDPKNSGKGGT